MPTPLESCKPPDKADSEVSSTLSATFDKWRSSLLGKPGSPEVITQKQSLEDCLTERSAFAPPRLTITDDRNAGGIGNSEANVQATLKQLKQLVGAERLRDCLEQTGKLSQGKREDFLRTMGQILNDSSANPDSAKRNQLAEGIIEQVANTAKIKQGHKGTCGLASIEVDIAAARPDAYARAIYQWSKQIDYRDKSDGGDAGAVIANPMLVIERGEKSRERSLASRIFQTGAANLALASSNQRYEDFSPSDAPEIRTPSGSFKPTHDTGERVVDASGKILTWNGVDAKDQERVLKQLTSEKFVSTNLHPKSPDALVEALRLMLNRDKTPVNVGLHFVEGGHGISVVKVEKHKNSADVYYLNTAADGAHVRKMSGQRLFDATIDGKNVLRIGAPDVIDGRVYRKPLPIPDDAANFVSVVHRDGV